MILHFEADAVEAVENDLDILIVGFYSDENYLMIQHSFEYDEQDVRLGMDTYHIERDDQSYSGYGGVNQINLRRNSINVELDETGRNNLQCEGIQVDFETDEENYKILTEKLKEIFVDSLTVK